jgi:hypothetical protein
VRDSFWSGPRCDEIDLKSLRVIEEERAVDASGEIVLKVG